LIVAVLLVVLIPLGVVWVHDQVQGFIHGISRGLGNLAAGMAEFFTATYEAAAAQVLADEALARELGEPLTVGNLNDVTWLESTVPSELRFRFPVSGSKRDAVVEFRAYEGTDPAKPVRLEMTSVELSPGAKE